MKRESRHPIWSWIIHTPWVLAVLGILSVIVFFGSGAGNPLLSRLLIHRLEVATGGKAELRGLSIQWLSLRATLQGLVIHGREPVGTEALAACFALSGPSGTTGKVSATPVDLSQCAALEDAP